MRITAGVNNPPLAALLNLRIAAEGIAHKNALKVR